MRGDAKCMKRCGFIEKEIEPSDVFNKIKSILSSEGFALESQTVKEGFWDIRAGRKDVDRVAIGRVRDADVVISGRKGKFEVTFKLGVWGKDLPVPVVEGVMTLGIPTVRDLHEEHELESRIWEKIVHNVDPSLLICERCGMVLRSEEDMKGHAEFERHHYLNTLVLNARMGFEGVREDAPLAFLNAFYV